MIQKCAQTMQEHRLPAIRQYCFGLAARAAGSPAPAATIDGGVQHGRGVLT